MTVPAYQSFTEAKETSDVFSITIDKPSGVVEGDLIIAAAQFSSQVNPVTQPSSWTDVVDGWPDYVGIRFCYKVAGASEPSNYTFSWSDTGSPAYAFIVRISGHDASSPINISNMDINESASATCPSVTTTVDDCLILRLAVLENNSINVDSGYPSGTTGITFDYANGASWQPTIGAAYESQVLTGATGTASFSLTASEIWMAITIAIQPASAVSASPSASPSASISASPSASISASPSGTPSASPSATPSASISASVSGSPSASISASPSGTLSASPSASPSVSGDELDTSGYGVYTGSGTVQKVENTFVNLSHLEGETVKILGTDVDDNTTKYDDETVSGGAITLMVLDPHAHNFVRKATVGLPYRYELKPMRLDVSTAGGTTKGSIKKFAEVVISFYNTLNAKYGKDTDNLHDITWPSSTELYTGDRVVVADGGFGVEDNFVISGDDPMPVTVRAIIPRVDKTGR